MFKFNIGGWVRVKSTLGINKKHLNKKGVIIHRTIIIHPQNYLYTIDIKECGNVIKICEYNLESVDSVLIGDSFNDYEAAKFNEINFYGYNNKSLQSYDYIEKFQDLEI